MRFIKIRSIFKIILILLALCTAIALLLNVLVQRAAVQQYLLGQLGNLSGYAFKSGKMHLSFRGGIGLVIDDLEARSLAGTERFEAPEFGVTLRLKEMIQGRVSVSKVFISRPRISVALERDPKALKDVNKFSVSKMISAGLAGLEYASISQASVSVTNRPFGFQGLDFEAYPIGKDPVSLAAHMRGNVVSDKESVPFSLQGTIISDEKIGNGLSAEIELKSGRFPLKWIPWPPSLPWDLGTAQLDIRFSAEPGGGFSAKGKISAADVCFSVVRRDREKAYAFEGLEVDFVSRFSDKIFEIKELNLIGSDFSVSGSSKFDFTDKRSPHIFFTVETPFMPLATLKRIFPTSVIPSWVEHDILSIVSGGRARLAHFSMNGTRDQYSHLKSPENADVMSMQVEWSDMTVLKDGWPLPFEQVAGEYRLEKGRHLVNVTPAVFGDSTIEHAALDSHRLLGEYQYRITLGGRFKLDDLRQQAGLYFMPLGLQKGLEGFQTTTGRLEGSVQIGFKRDWTQSRILEGNLMARGCRIEHHGMALPLSLDQAELVVNADGKNRFQGNGLWGRSEFQVSGSTDREWENVSVQIRSHAQISEIIDLVCEDPGHFLLSGGPVPLQADVFKKNDLWICQGTVGLDPVILDTDVFRLDPPGKADRAVFDVELLPEKMFRAKHVRCDLGRSIIEMSGRWDLKHPGAMNLTVTADRLILKDLGSRFKGQDLHAQGAIRLNLSLKRVFRDALETSVTGELMGNDISFDMEQWPSPVHDCSFTMDFSEKAAMVHSLTLSVGQTPIKIQGHLKGWAGLKGQLDIQVDHLDASDFIDKDTFVSDRKFLSGPFMEKTDIGLRLFVQKGSWRKFSFGPLEAKCDLRSGDLYVEWAEAAMEHGTLSLSGHIKHLDGPERLSFSSRIQMEGQPANDLLYGLGLEKKVLEGTLAMTADLSARGNGKTELISGLQGNGHFRLEKGLMHSPYGVFYKILDVLSIQNILKRRMPELSKEAFPFEYLEAHVGCREGILATHDLTMASPIFNAVTTGSLDLPKEQVDFVIWTQTLETMDSVVSKVPIIGYLLTEKERAPKGVLIYPVEMTGNWSDPEIKYVPSLTRLKNGVFNIFKRILNVPGHYFKKISGKKKKREKGAALLSFFGTEFEKFICTP